MRKFSAPEIDILLRVLDNRSYNPEAYDNEVKIKINKLYELLDKIKPQEGGDDLKILYFSVNRGSIEQYGTYEELKEFGDVSSYEEFEKNFYEDYPEDIYWYRMVTSSYKNYRAISINYKSVLYADMDIEGDNFINRNLEELLEFLIYKVEECIKMLENNTYNDYVAKNLSYKNRFGAMKRSGYWNLYPDARKNLIAVLTEDEINYFIENASDKIDDRIKNMTSGKYFESVRLAYENNGYDIDGLSDKELYLKYADGRDEGLSKIDSNSSMEFDDWFNDRSRFGGHPWEIMRGHSFYRVNLYIRHDENGYYLSLDGSIILRKIEIVKIYLALKKNNIPISIYNVDVIKESLSGNDYIGIVPFQIMPIRCESYFKDYKPLEFIHFEDEKIFDYVIWQDIEKVYLKESKNGNK